MKVAETTDSPKLQTMQPTEAMQPLKSRTESPAKERSETRVRDDRADRRGDSRRKAWTTGVQRQTDDRGDRGNRQERGVIARSDNRR